MEVFYYVVFGALAAVVAGLELGKSGKDRVATTSAFNSFKNNYVLVYSLMMCTPPVPPLPFFSLDLRTPLWLVLMVSPVACPPASNGDGFVRAAGDWLQGPYVYYLYSQYGFDKGDIGRLFIAGFGSSMLFGTIVGSLADKQYAQRPRFLFFPYSEFQSQSQSNVCVCVSASVCLLKPP
jgi:MFS transporter, MFS domain-containing protein family, molybdate-anion transporter